MKLPIVDFHVHVGPSLTLGLSVSIEEVLRQMDEASVDMAVILPFPSTAISGPSILDWLLKLSEECDRLIPFYYALNNLEPPRDARFRGVKWHWHKGLPDSKSNYSVLSDPRLEGFFEVIVKMRVPVIFEEELEFTSRFVEMFPDVTLVIPHLGLLGGDPVRFLERFKHNPLVNFDTSLAPRDYVCKFIETLGSERVLFGSDVPFGYMKHELDKILSLKLKDDDKVKVLSENALRLIGLKRSLY